MARQRCFEGGRTPFIAVFGRRAFHLPAGQRRAGHLRRAFAQQQRGDAAGRGGKGQFAAGHQIQASGIAAQFQHQRANLWRGQDVRRCRQSLGRIGRAKQDQLRRVATQFQKPVGTDLAIFQRFIIGPHPEQRPPFSMRRVACCLDRQAGGKTRRRPIAGMDFVQGAGQQSATQRSVSLGHPQRQRRPLGWESVTGHGMSQICQFFTFVHVMFQCMPPNQGVKPADPFPPCKSVMLRRNWWHDHIKGNSEKNGQFPVFSPLGQGNCGLMSVAGRIGVSNGPAAETGIVRSAQRT